MSAGLALPRRRLGTMAGRPVLGIAALGLVALLAPLLVQADPLATDMARALLPPGPGHWAGTDQLGRDVFSRLVAAARLDLAIAFAATALAFVPGILVGSLCGYLGGRADRALGRATDALMALPLFVLAIALAALLGNGIHATIAATALVDLPFHLRLARAETAARRDAPWVEAARICGDGPLAVAFGTVLPNVLPGLAVGASLNLGWSLLNAAGLSFIGLGVRPPTPEWGIMIAEGARYMGAGCWWLVACPGLALTLAMLCFALCGDGLRDMLDPRRRT